MHDNSANHSLAGNRGFHHGLRRLVFFLLIVAAFTVMLRAQDRIPLVVLDFEGYGISQPESVTLTNRLRNELFRFEKFQVVERGLMERILAEQNFQMSGCVSNECLVEIGRLVGAQQTVGGSIGKVGDVYSISARIIDVGTGEILQVADYDVSGDLSLVLTEGMAQVAAILADTSALVQSAQIEPVPQQSTPEPETTPLLSRSVSLGLDFSMLIGFVDDDEEGITRIMGITPMLGMAIKRYVQPAQPGRFNRYWGYGTDFFVLPYVIFGADYLFRGRANAYVGVAVTSRVRFAIVPIPVVSGGVYF